MEGRIGDGLCLNGQRGRKACLALVVRASLVVREKTA